MATIDPRAVTAVATAIGLAFLLSVGVGASSAAIDGETTRLSGTVTDEDGETIFGATVTVNGSDREARTNADGFYSLELEEGAYEVTVEADGYEPKTWNESLSAGRWTRTDVTLTDAPTELEGTVTNPDDDPVANATVHVVDTDLETTTDGDGRYAFELEPGRYSLETSAEGYNTRVSGVTVAENRVTTRDVQLSDGSRSDGERGEDEGDDEPDDPDDSGDESNDEDGGDDVSDAGPDTADDDSTSVDADEVDTATDATDDSRDDDSPPPTNREQVLTVLFFAGTFLGAMIAAASVGLYRNRSRQS